MINGRCDCAVVTVGTQIFVFVRKDGTLTVAFDMETLIWTPLLSMEYTSKCTATAVGTQIYVFGFLTNVLD